MPRPSSAQARAGLAYERKAAKALSASGLGLVSHNPWFYYEDDNGPGNAIPDIVLNELTRELTAIFGRVCIVAECKLTYRPEAIVKLRQLYCPIVARATGRPIASIFPLVISKHLTSSAPVPAYTIAGALSQREPLLHWLGKGPIGV